MKMNIKSLLFGLMAIVLVSCDKSGSDFSKYKPVLMDRTLMENAVKASGVQALHIPGKVVIVGNTIYVSEKFYGIHIVDNSDVNNPRKVSFISIPGITDFQLKSNMLYANSSVDLLGIDISNPIEPKVASRVKSAFPVKEVAPDGKSLQKQYQMSSWPTNSILIGWESI